MATTEDHSGQILHGRSFKAEHLDGANFSEADLRGADFSYASLVGANFTDAKLGLRPITGALLFVAALIASIVAGILVGVFAETVRHEMASSDWRDVLAAVLMVVVAVSFFGVLVLKGMSTALRAFAVALGAVLLIDFVVVFVFSGELRFRNSLSLIVMLVLIGPAAVAGILGRLVGGTFGAWAIAIVAVIGGVAAGRAQGGVAAIVVSVLLIAVSKRALKGDQRDGPMRYLTQRIATRRGTRFIHADLTRAVFTGTNPIHCDLDSANTTGTVWEAGHFPYTREDPSKAAERANGASK